MAEWREPVLLVTSLGEQARLLLVVLGLGAAAGALLGWLMH